MNQSVTSGRILTKEYDFRVMDNLDEFDTSYTWPRKEVINREKAFYVDPNKVPKEHNPFVLSDIGLSIVAKPTPQELYEYAHGISNVDLETYDDELTASERKNAFPMPLISGLLTTKSKGHSQLYGYWEISAMLPSARGAWPAFWLLPTHKTWPKGIAKLPEIDILEAVKDVVDGVYHGSLHTNESGVMVSSKGNEIVTNADLVGEYHRYGLSWEEDYIVWYFDGVEVLRRKTPGDMKQTPAHVLVNLAVGGWGGEPDLNDYPALFDIEWLRIYESIKPKADLPDENLPGDIVYWLKDGRYVTLSEINKVTEYMIQSSEDAVNRLNQNKAG